MFRAYEPDRDRLVAIKLFRLDLAPERVHQLAAELEGLVAADVKHPVLASAIAAGITGVSAYLVQDFVAADSLDLVLREHGPSSIAEAIRLATQLANGLDAAAAAGLVHGALHPRDVLVSSDAARLTGIGIARALERAGVPPHLRRPYTAPERAEGTDWDRPADVFSLAAVVHEMIWGRRLAGTGERAAESLTKIAGADLAALRRVYARALADDPAQRFDTALAFVEALSEACLNAGGGRPVASRVRLRDAAVPPPAEPAPRLPLEEPVLVLTPPSDDAEFAVDADERVLDRPVEGRFDLPDVDAFAAESGATDAAPAAAELADDAAMVYAIDEPDARSSTSVRPLALALLLGVAIGFAGGYALGYRTQPGEVAAAIGALPATAAVSVEARSTPESSVAAREFTESPIKDARDVLLPSPPVASAPSAPSTSTPSEGRLQIKSTPSGARVFVDGQEVGRTPTTRSLAKGGHDVRIVHDGYAPAERRVMVTPAAAASVVTIPLTRARVAPPAAPAPLVASAKARGRGVLGVESRPSGASVYVDGKLVGTTPLSLPSVEAGEHTVHLERDGYRRWNSSVRIVAGERNRVAASLER